MKDYLLPVRDYLLRYRYLAIAAVAVALLLGAGAGWASSSPEPQWQNRLWLGAAKFPEPSPKITTPPPAKMITLSGVGDIVMGEPSQGHVAANEGRNFFDQVKHLFTADIVMGNLEQNLTDDTGVAKCAPDSTNCHAFRTPPSYAQNLKNAGFHLLNQANNHGTDYGTQGYVNTQKALTAAGLKYCGPRNYISMADVNGVKVAVLGFSSYDRDNPLLDFNAAKEIVAKAKAQADIVVIQVHWGAEGADKGHVKPGNEYFLGENRGDPIGFSHAVIDAGADIIFGHGPHTVRAVEIYKGRMIAYSLGNFAGGGGLAGGNIVGWGGVLKATVNTKGEFVSANFTSTMFDSQPGVPRVDPKDQALNLMRQLTEADFPSSGAHFGPGGTLSTL